MTLLGPSNSFTIRRGDVVDFIATAVSPHVRPVYTDGFFAVTLVDNKVQIDRKASLISL